MRYGYVSIEGWAALACWVITAVLFAAALVSHPAQVATPEAKQRAPATVRRKPSQASSPRPRTVSDVTGPLGDPLQLAAGGLALAGIILTVHWSKNRLRLARTKLRAEAWAEGRAEARRRLAKEANEDPGRK